MWITFGRFCGCLAVDSVDKGESEHNFCEKCYVYHKKEPYVIRKQRGVETRTGKNEFFVKNRGIG